MPKIKYQLDADGNQMKIKPFCFSMAELIIYLLVFTMIGAVLGNQLPGKAAKVLHLHNQSKADSVIAQEHAMLEWCLRDSLMQRYIRNSGERIYLINCEKIYLEYQTQTLKRTIKYPNEKR